MAAEAKINLTNEELRELEASPEINFNRAALARYLGVSRQAIHLRLGTSGQRRGRRRGPGTLRPVPVDVAPGVEG